MIVDSPAQSGSATLDLVHLPCRGILVDFDGLLISTEHAGWLSWRALFQTYGGDLAIEDFASHVGGNAPLSAWEELDRLAGAQLDHARLEGERRMFRDAAIRPYPGGLELLLGARRSGLCVGLVSNSPIHWIKRQLRHVEIPETCFDLIVSGEYFPPKPASHSYEYALAWLGLSAEEAVAFEDSAKGVLAAQGAGLRCVALPNEVTAHLDLGHADLSATSLEQVRAVRGGVSIGVTNGMTRLAGAKSGAGPAPFPTPRT